MSRKEIEILHGERFEFGANWERFLSVLDEERVDMAKISLCQNLDVDALAGKTFLDIGSGSGLYSLAARRLGAKVYSFDYDPQSVACTKELKRRYFPGDDEWVVERGSVLDRDYLLRLGRFDVVYSWGVLHHTGKMWEALGNVESLVKVGGKLFIAIYNDQGGASRRWIVLKRLYIRNTLLRMPLTIYTLIRQWSITFIHDALRGRPLVSWKNYKKTYRGMSAWHDAVDWIGGYPFEVAKPEDVFEFFRERNFLLERLKTCAGSIGCNEYVFTKDNPK
jgi:2-polyprenyl-6-hydroxyphenyl methylase/3-demethylubiquinone-9 3-methyltransferase